MRIWLATVGEPLPSDGPDVRLLRTGQFAAWLAEQGDDVVFLTGTMDHYGRKLRSEHTETIEMAPNYAIVLLTGRLYIRSISPARIGNHRDVAKSFALTAPSLVAPDIIFASYPTIELCKAILDYAAKRGIPVVIDVRDFWPDIFADLLPPALRPLASPVLRMANRRLRKVLAHATALCGFTGSALQWALKKAGRKQSQLDFWFPFTFPRNQTYRSQNVSQSGAPVKNSPIHFCFFGTHSPRVNLEMFVEAFRVAIQRGLPVTVTFAGTGEAHTALKQIACGVEGINFPGWLDAQGINHVMNFCDLGILPYNAPDFHLSIPNKIIDYLFGGLPVLSCTDGEIRNLINTTQCGFWCQPDVESIVAMIEYIVAHPDELASAKQAARKTYETIFASEKVFENVRNHLMKIRNATTV